MKRNAVNRDTSHGERDVADAANPGNPELTVSAVARLIAVAPATLRTWDRRYGLGPSLHKSGTHRRYGHEDVLRLSIMRLWIFKGATSSQAASYARTVDLAQIDHDQIQQDLRAQIAKAEDLTVHNAGTPPSAAGTKPDIANAAATIEPSVGARVTPIKHLRLAAESVGITWRDRCSQLVSCALRNDAQGVADCLRLSEAADLIQWWKRLVHPAIERLASHTVLASPGQSPRLLVSSMLLAELARVTQDVSGVPTGHPSRLQNMVLVFAPSVDRVSLSAHVLTGALVQDGLNGHIVTGPDSPERIVDLVAMARPVALVFMADLAPHNPDLLLQLVDKYPNLPIFIGLGGAEPLSIGLQVPQVSRIRSFTGLFHEVVAVANAPTFGSDYWDEKSRLVSLDHLK